MTQQLVIRQDKDKLCTLTINRPDKLNSLNLGVFQELRDHVNALKDDSTIHCVVVRGAGKCFSAGHDLADISEGEESPSLFWHSEILRMLEKLPKPVIAAVHGHCYTGALEVALAADFIIAAESAKFGDTHAKWALTPLWGMSQRLPRRVGVATAKRLMFSCEMIDAAEAFRIGLCEKVCADETFEADVETLAASIAANSPYSHAANKQLLDATDGCSLDAGILYEVMNTAGEGPDMQQRIQAFLNRK